MNDTWDLSVLYRDFEDEAIREDLDKLSRIPEKMENTLKEALSDRENAPVRGAERAFSSPPEKRMPPPGRNPGEAGRIEVSRS